jgi:ABC-type multidrug transport system ATPase subunit
MGVLVRMRALQAEGLVKVLGGARVLRGIEASFVGGVVHVIEGANGSGKSTLLSLLGGRMSPSSGRVRLVDAAAELASGAALRRSVGWLGHDLGLYPDLTALENVALHCRLRGLAVDEIWRRGAEELGVESIARRRVREMSRGQRQRVALLRALVGEPPVLLLDEPSTGLDATTTERLVAMLLRLRAEGRVVVVVTHDLPFRDRLAATEWKLVSGKLSPSGSTGVASASTS